MIFWLKYSLSTWRSQFPAAKTSSSAGRTAVTSSLPCLGSTLLRACINWNCHTSLGPFCTGRGFHVHFLHISLAFKATFPDTQTTLPPPPHWHPMMIWVFFSFFSFFASAPQTFPLANSSDRKWKNDFNRCVLISEKMGQWLQFSDLKTHCHRN